MRLKIGAETGMSKHKTMNNDSQAPENSTSDEFLKRANRDKELLQKIYEIKPEETREQTEIGFAEIYRDLFSSELVYNATAKSWYFYDGRRWVCDKGEAVAAECARNMYYALMTYGISIKEKGTDFIERVKKYSNYNKRKTLVTDAKTLMTKTREDFDNKANLFNCLNCTLNLTTMKAHPHTPTDMLTMISGCNYAPVTNNKKWETFINDITQGDKEKQAYLQSLCGYFLTSYTWLEAAFFLYGATTRNGKSTFMETFCAMMGDYAKSAPPDTLADLRIRNASGINSQLARLQGVRLLNLPEVPKSMKLDAALFKSLTGGEKVSTRDVFEKVFEYQPQFKICINCNYLPVVSDSTVFKSDRIRIITFDKHFSPQEQNKQLKQELRNPEILSSVLNWALNGLLIFNKNGEIIPKSVISATKEYNLQNDKTGLFFDECLEHKNGFNIPAKEVYTKYIGWCEANDFHAEGKQEFFERLRTQGCFRSTATIDGKTVRNVVTNYNLK